MGSGRRHFEDRAVIAAAAAGGGPVEVPVAALHQSSAGRIAISSGEIHQGGHRPGDRHFKDRADSAAAASGSGPIEIPVAGLYELGTGSLR